MIQLSRISLVQWHLFVKADLDVQGDAAILGPNRSGKSTLIDLIQTVMTGGAANLYKFNRSAGDGGGRSERTLRAYCLGQLDEHATLRNDAITHIALVFQDEDGARPPVTVGLCVEASVRDEARIEGRYVAVGLKADTSLFLEDHEGGGQRSAAWPVVRDRLERACAGAGGRLLRNDTARAHIKEYMRQLFTDRRAPDADLFARTFVMALSFSDIPSVEEFVRRHLLEKNDIDIGELRESIQRYRQIQKDIHELERRLEALRALQSQIGRFADLQKKEQVARGVERTAALIEAASALLSNLAKRRAKQRELAEASREIDRYQAQIDQTEETIRSLEAQINASDIASQRAVLTSEQRRLEASRADVLRRLQGRFAAASAAVELLNWRERLQPLRLGEVLHALEAVQRLSGGLHPPDWPRDPVSLDRQLDLAAKAAEARRQRVADERDQAIARRQQAREAVAEADRRLNQARTGAVPLNRRTEALMEALRREGMTPRVLCEVLDVADDAWRDAAEALLARDSEAIIVAPDHAQRAVEIYRRGRDAFRGCRVANTRRLAGESTTPPPGSLASTLVSDEPLAMAFVVGRLGGVRLAATEEELVGARRAIMQDGAYNDGIVVETRRPTELKIGRTAAQLMQGHLEKTLADEREIQREHDARARFLEDVGRRLERLVVPTPQEDRLETLVDALADHEERLRDAQQRLANLLAQVDPALHAELEEARAQVKTLTRELGERREARGKVQGEIGQVEANLGQGEGLPGSWLCLRSRRRRFREQVGDLALFAPVREQYARLRTSRSPSRIAQETAREAELAAQQWRGLEFEIRDAVTRYRMDFGIEPPVVADGAILKTLSPWIDEGVTALEGNELIRYRRHADEAAEQIVRLFRTAFVHELNSRFSAVESEIDGVNRALRTRPLHGEIYALRASVRPEFEGLYRLARESESDDETLAALFGRGEPRDDRHAEALAAVERLLQDESLSFELYQDYRNYYTFDLRMRDVKLDREVSFDRRRGVASGAERQVPFYVIIGSALANLYHGSRPSSAPGLGLAVFDEAFSKMDGPNQRTLLAFYRDIGLQVLIAAPSEKRAAVYENLDTIIDVHRFGDDVAVETSYIKEKARAAMREANPQHLTDEALRARLDEADASEVAAE